MWKRLCLRIPVAISALMLFGTPARPAWQGIGGMTPAALPKGNQATFRNSRATAVVTVLAPDLVRVRMIKGTTPGPDYSWAVIKTDWPQVEPRYSEGQGEVLIRTSEIEVRIQLNPFRVAFYDRAGRLISKDKDSLGPAWD